MALPDAQGKQITVGSYVWPRYHGDPDFQNVEGRVVKVDESLGLVIFEVTDDDDGLFVGWESSAWPGELIVLTQADRDDYRKRRAAQKGT